MARRNSRKMRKTRRRSSARKMRGGAWGQGWRNEAEMIAPGYPVIGGYPSCGALSRPGMLVEGDVPKGGLPGMNGGARKRRSVHHRKTMRGGVDARYKIGDKVKVFLSGKVGIVKKISSEQIDRRTFEYTYLVEFDDGGSEYVMEMDLDKVTGGGARRRKTMRGGRYTTDLAGTAADFGAAMGPRGGMLADTLRIPGETGGSPTACTAPAAPGTAPTPMAGAGEGLLPGFMKGGAQLAPAPFLQEQTAGYTFEPSKFLDSVGAPIALRTPVGGQLDVPACKTTGGGKRRRRSVRRSSRKAVKGSRKNRKASRKSHK